MTDYPLPVERLTPDKAVRLVCPRCAFERDATEEEIGLCAGLGSCGKCSPAGDGPGRWSFLTWKYQEADRCKGCGELGWFPETLNSCCSRPCMLQAEYAETLGRAS